MITLEDIKSAQARIAGVAVNTPLVHYARTPPPTGRRFPSRRASNPWEPSSFGVPTTRSPLSLPDQRRQGVIAFSSGNHAQGVAYAARAMGIRAVIVMPARAPAIKRTKTLDLGAEIVTVEEGGEEEWRVAAESLAAERGLAMVPPFDDETIIAGQATVGLEILQDLPDVELVLVPIGGGGLISGVAAALKLSRPDIHVVGVEPEWANDAQASLRSGRIVELPIEQTRQNHSRRHESHPHRRHHLRAYSDLRGRYHHCQRGRDSQGGAEVDPGCQAGSGA